MQLPDTKHVEKKLVTIGLRVMELYERNKLTNNKHNKPCRGKVVLGLAYGQAFRYKKEKCL
jgi:hypothetical protein